MIVSRLSDHPYNFLKALTECSLRPRHTNGIGFMSLPSRKTPTCRRCSLDMLYSTSLHVLLKASLSVSQSSRHGLSATFLWSLLNTAPTKRCEDGDCRQHYSSFLLLIDGLASVDIRDVKGGQYLRAIVLGLMLDTVSLVTIFSTRLLLELGLLPHWSRSPFC